MGRSPDLGRRVTASLAEIGIKAYGAAAAVSVAFSEAESVGGKIEDAAAAVPNLVERYHDVKYAIDHREEVQGALDYVDGHGPDAEQLETTAQESAETIGDVETTFREIDAAWEALGDISVRDGFSAIPEAAGHLGDAWAARPDLGSLRQVTDAAADLAPFVAQVDVLASRIYESLLLVGDNFASDEIATTIGVMAGAFGFAYVLGTVVGFWGRRGRPGLVARALQRAGARFFRGWYVRHAEYALTPPLYAAARERIQHDIVVDPQRALDPEAFRELELYFERRRR